MKTTQWKKVELEIARLLDGERVPVSGRQRGSTPDIDHPWLSLEVKHRKTLPAWLADAMDQAQASNDGTQLPLVILHQSKQQYKDSYAVVRLSDFIEWFGK
jgi:hypothetical protein